MTEPTELERVLAVELVCAESHAHDAAMRAIIGDHYADPNWMPTQLTGILNVPVTEIRVVG